MRRPPLVGRAQERETVLEALRAPLRGRGQAVLVVGEAGAGKTRLMTEAAAAAETVDLAIVWVAAHELDRLRPLAALRGALDVDLESEHPTGLAAEAAETRFRALDACIEAIEARALERPLALVVEDLQWADPATLAVVAAAARRLDGLPLAILATMRPTPQSPETARIVDDLAVAGATRVDLGPLDDDAVANLVDGALGAKPGAGLLDQLHGAGGNPFFVLELLGALEAEGAVQVAGGTADTELAAAPVRLRETVLRRLAVLPEDVLELLQIAAVLGPVFTLAELATVLDRPASQLLRPIEQARKAGVVGEDGGRLAFRHDLVREAIYADLPATITQALHADAGRALAAADADPTRVARHLLLGGSVGAEADAASWLRRAASEVGATDPAAAADLLEHAHGLAAPAQQADLLPELVSALSWAGRLDEAEARARVALSAGGGERTTALLEISLAETLGLRGDAAGAVMALDAAAACAALSERRRARLHADAASARLWTFDLDGAAQQAMEAVRWGERLGDPVPVTVGRAVECRLAAFAGDFARAVELGQQAVVAAGDDPDAHRRTPRLYLGLALVNADRPLEAQTALREGLRHSTEIGAAPSVGRFHQALTLCAFHAGWWDDAIAEAEAGRVLADDVGARHALAQSEAMIGLIALHRGQLDAVRAAQEVAEAELARPGADPSGWIWLLWLRALLAEVDGDFVRATRRLGSAYDLALTTGVRSVRLWYGPELVRLALAAGDRERAAAVGADVEVVAARAGTATAAGASRFVRGLLGSDPDALVGAIGAYRGAHRPLGAVRAAEAAAPALAAAGRRDEAVAVLREGLELATELGAAHHERWMGAQLRDLGAGVGARGRRRRPATGWESLTPTEGEVVRLAAEGLSNPEIGARLFISRRTVGTHLSHVFAKLGVRSRTELTAAALGEREA